MTRAREICYPPLNFVEVIVAGSRVQGRLCNADHVQGVQCKVVFGNFSRKKKVIEGYVINSNFDSKKKSCI